MLAVHFPERVDAQLIFFDTIPTLARYLQENPLDRKSFERDLEAFVTDDYDQHVIRVTLGVCGKQVMGLRYAAEANGITQQTARRWLRRGLRQMLKHWNDEIDRAYDATWERDYCGISSMDRVLH